VKVVFPMPAGNATVILRPSLERGGGLRLSSRGARFGDAGFYRFFAYMGLFMFSMLVLVMGSNFLMMFVGWEGVGLCSYLLIGYYFERQEAANASRKAFITNRVGDFGFALAIFGVIATFGSAQYTEVVSQAAGYPVETLGHWGLMSWIAPWERLAAWCPSRPFPHVSIPSCGVSSRQPERAVPPSALPARRMTLSTSTKPVCARNSMHSTK